MKSLSDEQKAELTEQAEVVHDAYEAYLGAVQDAQQSLDDIKQEMQEFFDEQPESWQESKAGQAYSNWIAAWDLELNEPEDLSDEINGLPDKP